MNPETIARLQFAFTVSFHIIFPATSIGLAGFLAFIEGMWLWTKDEVPVGAGTDATRVAMFNPFVSLYWLISGKTVGGLELYPEDNRMSREQALRLYTQGSSWFSTEYEIKGGFFPGQFADFAVLTDDFFTIPEEEIKRLESALTVVGGTVAYANHEFGRLAPPSLPASLDWAPTRHYGGYHVPKSAVNTHVPCRNDALLKVTSHSREPLGRELWGFGCDCFAF
jgi:hypothetical protein